MNPNSAQSVGRKTTTIQHEQRVRSGLSNVKCNASRKSRELWKLQPAGVNRPQCDNWKNVLNILSYFSRFALTITPSETKRCVTQRPLIQRQRERRVRRHASAATLQATLALTLETTGTHPCGRTDNALNAALNEPVYRREVCLCSASVDKSD